MAGSMAQNILDIESQNKGVVYIFKSGAFWNTYDFSAYVLMFKLEIPLRAKFAKFKVSPKTHNGVSSHVAIGFPDKTKQELLGSLNSNMHEVLTLSDAVLQISSKHHEFEKTKDYTDWLNKVFSGHKEMQNVAESIKKHKRKQRMLTDKIHEETEIPQFYEHLKTSKIYATANKLFSQIFICTRSCDGDIKRTLVDSIRRLAMQVCENLHCHLALNSELQIAVPLEKLNYEFRQLMILKQVSIGCWKSIAELINELKKHIVGEKRTVSETELTGKEKSE